MRKSDRDKLEYLVDSDESLYMIHSLSLSTAALCSCVVRFKPTFKDEVVVIAHLEEFYARCHLHVLLNT